MCVRMLLAGLCLVTSAVICGHMMEVPRCHTTTTVAPQVSPNVTRDAVLITGGRGGIGRAVAEALAATGYTAIVTVRKPADVDAIKAGGLVARGGALRCNRRLPY